MVITLAVYFGGVLDVMILLIFIGIWGATAVQADPKGFLLVAGEDNIFRVNLTTGVATRLPLQDIDPRGVTYDPLTSRVMWCNFSNFTFPILAATLDGKGLTELHRNTGLKVAYTMAWDTIRRKLYFRSGFSTSLLFSVKDEERPVIIANNAYFRSQISLHARTNALYYVNVDFDVWRVQGDNTSRLFSRPGDVTAMLGLAINPAGDTLYACGNDDETWMTYFYKFSLDTATLTSLGSRDGKYECRVLATDGQNVYTLNWIRDRVLVMPAVGPAADATVLVQLQSASDMTLVTRNIVAPTTTTTVATTVTEASTITVAPTTSITDATTVTEAPTTTVAPATPTTTVATVVTEAPPITDADCPPGHCLNGGTCAAAGYTFSCQCAAGFSGLRCEGEIGDCVPNPCKNGGVCEGSDNSFTCLCAPEFIGRRCDTYQENCTPNFCMNGGTCTDGVNAFTCKCTEGYFGSLCEVKPKRMKCYVCNSKDHASGCPPGLQAYCTVEKCHVKPMGGENDAFNWVRGCGCDESKGEECCTTPLCNVGNLASSLTISAHLAVTSATLAFFMNL